jgi:N utilization substance protein B
LEQTVKSALVDFQTSAQRYVHALAGNQVEDDEEGEANLATMEKSTVHEVDTALVRDERLSRDTFLEIMRHTESIARGVREQQATIDPVIEKAAPAFPIPQLASIDRAVLRVAVYELLYEPEVPFKAAINEAVEIAKRFGGPNSGKFTNGVLRTISEGLPESRKEQKPRPA